MSKVFLSSMTGCTSSHSVIGRTIGLPVPNPSLRLFWFRQVWPAHGGPSETCDLTVWLVDSINAHTSTVRSHPDKSGQDLTEHLISCSPCTAFHDRLVVVPTSASSLTISLNCWAWALSSSEAAAESAADFFSDT